MCFCSCQKLNCSYILKCRNVSYILGMQEYFLHFSNVFLQVRLCQRKLESVLSSLLHQLAVLKARSPFVLKHTTSMYICMYVWMVRMPVKRVRVFFSLLKRGFSGLTPVSSDTTTLTKFYFKLGLKIVRELLRKCLFFKTQTVAAPGY